MGLVFDNALSPNPLYYEIRGRAAEIARALGSQVAGAEHLFLGMLHDGGWPVNVIAPLADPGRVEAAVLAIIGSPGYTAPFPPRFLSRGVHVEMWGAEIAYERGDSYLGLEHACRRDCRHRRQPESPAERPIRHGRRAALATAGRFVPTSPRC